MRWRHAAYWMFVAVVLIPLLILYWAQLLLEAADPWISRIHAWAYREKYHAPLL